MGKRIVLDVTQLAEWPGRLTGVPRVMDEISSRSAASDYLLVVWDESTQCLKEVKYESMRVVSPEGSAGEPVATSMPSLKSVKRVVRGIERRVPPLERARRAAQQRLSQPAPAAAAANAYTPRPGDVFVVLWGTWTSQSYIDCLLDMAGQGVKLVQVVYDMLPVVTPQFSGHSTVPLETFAAAIYPRCDLLLAISEHTKKDIVGWLKRKKLTVPPIAVFRLGDDFSFSTAKRPTAPKLQQIVRENSEFILTVGTIEVRKNHTLLYYVYKLARARGIDLPPLVIVGRRGWQTDDIYALMTSDPEVKDSFIFLENASDAELSWLYEHCRFTIYQSFYEGWGLPIAESIARGVPCLASNTSSMPEIAGDLIGYFSPTSSDECLAAMQTMLNDDTLDVARQRLRQYKPTTWDETFATINAHLEELAA